jgi:hypothetical protein
MIANSVTGAKILTTQKISSEKKEILRFPDVQLDTPGGPRGGGGSSYCSQGCRWQLLGLLGVEVATPGAAKGGGGNSWGCQG